MTSNLTIRNNGVLTTYEPISVTSLSCGSPCVVTSSFPIVCTGNFTWQKGMIIGSGAITTGQFVASIPGSGAVSTNAKHITVLNGGSFNSGQTDSMMWNLGRIDLMGGIFSVISSKNHLFRGDGTFYVGPSATLHRSSQTSTLLHENVTTNAGTVKVTTGTVNFSGGYTQTTGGRTVASGGTVQIGAANSFVGGSLEGSSTINCTIANNGALTFSPGDASTAHLTLTTATLDAGDNVAIELGGTGQGVTYDWLSGTTINLGGASLAVCLTNGFEDIVLDEDSFTIITGNLSGTLGNLNNGRITTSNGEGSFQVAITTGAGGSVVLSDFLPMAPPGTIFVIH
jgi:hypothetical protein